MLKDVLREIKNAKLFSITLISRNLNLSEGMVEGLVEQLIRMGYLDKDLGSPTCETKCAGCSISNCNTKPIKMISLTDKGEKLLKNNL